MNIIRSLRIIKTKIMYGHKLGCLGKNCLIGKHVRFINAKGVSIGNNVSIGPNSFFGPVYKYEGEYLGLGDTKIEIGDGTIIGKHNSFAAVNKVKVGKNVLFAGYVHITDHNHGYQNIHIPIMKQPLFCKGPVIIEDNCWLGYGCEILSGVHIGTHSIVAARAVVTKDVPAYSIVAGNPARIVKKYDQTSKKWIRIC